MSRSSVRKKKLKKIVKKLANRKMFGALFEEEGVGDAYQTNVSVVPAPPEPRGPTQLAGIRNEGATCFLNVTLQAFAFIPEIRACFFRINKDRLERQMAIDVQEDPVNGEEKAAMRKIPIELQRLFASLMLEQKKAISVRGVTDSFRWRQAELTTQQDCHEMVVKLIEWLTVSLTGMPAEDQRVIQDIEDILHFTTVQKVICQRCLRTTETVEENCFTIVPVEGFRGGLEESLTYLYGQSEMMEGANKYYCGTCRDHIDAERLVKFRKLPPVMVMQLLRFGSDAKKIVDRFPFPHELDMSRYSEDCENSGDKIYELMLVVVHSGSVVSGHYTTYIRDVDNLGRWELDEQAEASVLEGVDTTNPRVTLATILDRHCSKSGATDMTINKLAAELNTMGCAWKKAYRKEHGSLHEFLKNNEDIFVVNKDRVSLLPGRVSSSDSCMVILDDQNDNCCMDDSPCITSPSQEGSSGTNLRERSSNWFFLNDATVTAVAENELAKTFSSRRSAYVLAYRQKGIYRPPEAEGNPAFGIPDYLIQEMNQKNMELGEERAEYERKKMEVNVEVLFQWLCFKENENIISTEDAVPIVVYKDDVLGMLLGHIRLLGGQCLEEGNFHVHRLMRSANTTTLCEEFTDVDKTLGELGIENGTVLFVSTSIESDGQPTFPGTENESVTSSPSGSNHDSGIAIDAQESIHSCVFEDDVSDAACVSSSQVISSPEMPDFELEVEVESNGADFISVRVVCDNHEFETELTVDRNMIVRSVKLAAMEAYGVVSNPDQFILREYHSVHVLLDPYDDNMTVANAGITSDTVLMLGLSKMVLHFRVDAPDFSRETSQVELGWNCMVWDCLVAMTQAAGITDPQEWHLCTTDIWKDEKHELNDLNMVMNADYNGCLLLLKPGRALPKDHISLPVYLHATPKQLYPAEGRVVVIGESEMLMSDLQISEAEGSGIKSYNIGEVCLHKDAKLETLRDEIVQLMEKSSHHVSPIYLRLRLMDKQHRLRKVLRDPQNTLRRLKVDGKSPIGVQILGLNTDRIWFEHDTADLCKEQILLNVQVRDGQTEQYGAMCEMVWDTRLGTSADTLKHDIASRLGMPEELVIIAKHFPDRFSWKILRDVPKSLNQTRTIKRGKKQVVGTRKSSILHKPFYLDDGDVIGVIVSATSSVNESDFLTAEDRLGQEQLEKAIREKQEERKGRTSLFDFNTRARRPEAPLKMGFTSDLWK